MKLRPTETELTGNWISSGDGVKADAVEKRIKELIDNHLLKIAINPRLGSWEMLFRDPADGRYWELTYPKSEMHGGGPKRLSVIEQAMALTKYGPSISN